MSLKVEVPEIDKVIAEAVQAEIRNGIVKALGGAEQIVASVVTGALTQKVENRGTYRTEPWMEKFVREVIWENVREVAAEILADHKEAIKTEIAKRFRADSKSLAESLVQHSLDGVVKNAPWHFTIQPVLAKED